MGILKEISISTNDGIDLKCAIYNHSKNKWLFTIHGLGEHYRRHTHYIQELFAKDYNLVFFDLRGHGKSTGKRAYIDDFSTYSHDFTLVLDEIKSQYGNGESFEYNIFSHSMGTLITSDWLKQQQDETLHPAKIFMSAPPILPHGLLSKVLTTFPSALKKMAYLPFGLDLTGMVNPGKLSHDPKVRDYYINDPLNSTTLNSKLLLQLLHKAHTLYNSPIYFKGELYVAIGSKDRVVDFKAAKKYFTKIHPHANFKIIEDGFHEMHFEEESIRNQYLDFVKSSLSV